MAWWLMKVKWIPLQEQSQENWSIGDVVHESALIQDWDIVGDQPFPGYIKTDMHYWK